MSPEWKYCLHHFCFPAGSWADWFAGAASALAVWAALIGFLIAHLYRTKDKRDEEINTAHQIGFKLKSLLQSVKGMYQHLCPPEDAWPTLEDGQARNYIEYIQPMIGYSIQESLRLNSKEISFLIKLKEIEFLGELDLLVKHNESLILSLAVFREKADLINSMLPPPIAMSGAKGNHSVSKEQFMALQPYLIAQNNLIVELRMIAEEAYRLSQTLAVDFHPMAKKHYPRGKFIRFPGIKKGS